MGRIYSHTAYLNPQGSDQAKGLLLFEKKTPLRENGGFWLRVHLANCDGEDKLSYEDRIAHVEKNHTKYMLWHEDPYTNRGWQDSDKPWSLLAAAREYAEMTRYEGPEEEFLSDLPCFVDGSCNGIQHLVALSLDENIAASVNVVDTDKPGDLYSLVSNDVWRQLNVLYDDTPTKYRGKVLDVIAIEKFHKNAMRDARGKPELSDIVFKNWKEYCNHNRSLRVSVFPAFWLGVTDPKEQRKTVKRCVMTLGYGASKYGFSNFLMEDLADTSEYLDNRSQLWCSQLGSLIYDTCFESLEGPGRMLKLFEEVGELSNCRKEYLSWVTPVGFPVMQTYPKSLTKRTKLSYAGKSFNVLVEAWEEATIAEASQRAATAPNFVHSLDAAHLQLVINNAEFHLAAIHDSVGASAGHMGDLYGLIREAFVSLYRQNPLEDFLEQVGYDKEVKKGNLNIERVLESKYLFS